jgi:hypothetical protein
VYHEGVCTNNLMLLANSCRMSCKEEKVY